MYSFSGPISRTLSYLRSKMDLALSTSSLYPSREDVRQWETSFESVLNNKCELTSFYIIKLWQLITCSRLRSLPTVLEEGVLWWKYGLLAGVWRVQEDEGRKEVDNTESHRNLQRVRCRALSKRSNSLIFAGNNADRLNLQVNLDSDTRAATKAAVEGGCKPDTFALAQSRVEQLMSKDSYRRLVKQKATNDNWQYFRFLRDRLFLDLLESYDIADKEDKPSSSRDKNWSVSLTSL